MDWALYWAQWLLAPVVSIAVSVIYFVTADRKLSFRRRVLVSMSGLSIATVYFAAMAVALTGHASRGNNIAFSTAQLALIALIVVSFKLYAGPKWVHSLQVPNILSLMWSAFIGGMAVTGEWL